MSGINKVILLGRVAQDIEVKYIPSGIAVANFSVATSEKRKDKLGDDQEKTEWHKIVVWKKLAELCGQYLNKGSQVYLEGKIETRSWDDKDGNKKYMTEIIASNVQFLDSKKESCVNKAESLASNDTGFTVDDIPF